MPLTDQQRTAVAQIRAFIENGPALPQLGTAASLDQRARLPDPAHLPDGVTVHVDIAPPSSRPHPLLNTAVLKTPERIPVYFYGLRDAPADVEPANTHVILYFHGGGNLQGHPTDPPFIQLFYQLLKAAASHSEGTASKFVVIAPCYRLATVPENTFPAALQDILAAYEHVINKGYQASNTILAGDSAGGNHAVVLAHLILQSNRPSPRGIVAFAPDVVHVLDQPREDAKGRAAADILTVPLLETLWGKYVGDSGVGWVDPLVSGAYIPFTASWPKTLILTGTGDLIYAASQELKRRLSAQNIAVELVEYDEYPHSWWSLPNVFLDDIVGATKRIAQFILDAP